MNTDISNQMYTYLSIQSNDEQPHKNFEILDPQSQVSIFNNPALVSNIRTTEDTLTLHGMGEGSRISKFLWGWYLLALVCKQYQEMKDNQYDFIPIDHVLFDANIE